MTLPAIDWTTLNGPFDWLFHSLDTQLFGSVGMTVLFLILVVFLILMFFNANKFTVFGFMTVLLIEFGAVGYTIVGWIAPAGAMLAGLILALAFIKMTGI